MRPVKGQVDDLLEEIRVRAARNERVLVTTLTKRMSEDLAEYFTEVGVRCRYLHSEIETLERVRILRDLRRGEFDVLIGINLLREGLDLPEVSLVAILDADKEGYLRSATSLIQTMGRCARHVEGRAILYADRMTDSMRAGHRRNQSPPRQAARLQPRERHHAAIHHQVRGHAARRDRRSRLRDRSRRRRRRSAISPTKQICSEAIAQLEAQMREAAKKFEFERAAALRDRIRAPQAARPRRHRHNRSSR